MTGYLLLTNGDASFARRGPLPWITRAVELVSASFHLPSIAQVLTDSPRSRKGSVLLSGPSRKLPRSVCCVAASRVARDAPRSCWQVNLQMNQRPVAS